MADNAELKKIRGTIMRFVSMLDEGSRRRTAGLDLAPFRSPGRPDFIIWWALENFGGSPDGVPLTALQSEITKAGYTWDESMRGMFDARLGAYGMKITDADWSLPNYNTPTREMLLKSSDVKKHVVKLAGKFWS